MGAICVRYIDVKFENKYTGEYTDIKVRAVIASEPEDKEYKYTYTIIVKEVDGEESYNNTKLLVDLKNPSKLEQIPQFGDEVLIVGSIEKANEARNFKGFDYSKYLKSKNIHRIIEANSVEILGKNKIDFFSTAINQIQNNVKENITKLLGQEESALCIGILIGNTMGISEETEDNFKKSNLTHLLAVSGSHITYIITAFSSTLGKRNKKSTKIITIIFLLFFTAITGFTPSVLRASIMGILVLLASLLHRKSDTINNLGISSLLILIYNPYYVTDLGFLLSFAGTIGIVILNDKISNFLNGKLNKKSNKIIKYIIESFSITLSANLIIIPVMAYSFSTISFTFWISNILAGPVMEAATILGFVVYFVSLTFFPLAKFIGIFLNVCLSILLGIANFSAKLPFSLVYIKTPYLLECVAYYMALCAIFNWSKVRELKSLWTNVIQKKFTWKDISKESLKWKNETSKINDIKHTKEEKRNEQKDGVEKRQYNGSREEMKNNRNKRNKKIKITNNLKKIISTVLVFIFLSSIFFMFLQKRLEIYFVDVGQGDCTLIKTPTNKTILIDGGGSEFGSFDVGERILLPYLLDRRINNIDYILISHFDSDHIGGLFYIMENLKVKNIIISKQGENSENLKKFLEITQSKKTNIILVEKGDVVKIDKYSYFEILFPEDNLIKENILNNNSIVAKFNSLGLRILFTGDIEEVAENRLCEMYKNTDKLKSEILKVAHHGSKTSSTEQFLELVQPKMALIGAGVDNKFGHPHQITLDKIQKYTDYIYRTDLYGEIQISYNRRKINVKTFNGL